MGETHPQLPVFRRQEEMLEQSDALHLARNIFTADADVLFDTPSKPTFGAADTDLDGIAGCGRWKTRTASVWLRSATRRHPAGGKPQDKSNNHRGRVYYFRVGSG